MTKKIVNSGKLVPGNVKNARDVVGEFNYYCGLFFPQCSFSKKMHLACGAIKEYFVNGAWVNNYFQYGFYGKNPEERANFMTWRKAVKFIKKMNGTEAHPVLREKQLFNEAFSKFVKRDWIFMKNASEADFIKFCTKHKTFIEKPNDEQLGAGIFKRLINENTDLTKMYHEYYGKSIVLEENVLNCDTLSELHPDSLNTLRVSTLLNKSKTKATLVAATLKMGAGGNAVDNAGAGGLSAAINLDTGIVSHKAINYKGKRYEFHPDTNKAITGLAIPAWQMVVDMCKEAALVYKDAPFIGWDVAISYNNDTEEYIVQIIEGNENQAFPLIQMSSGEGLVKKINEINSI